MNHRVPGAIKEREQNVFVWRRSATPTRGECLRFGAESFVVMRHLLSGECRDSALAETTPMPGTRCRINLFRHDRSGKVGLAFSPTLTSSFHVPERFVWLEFAESD